MTREFLVRHLLIMSAVLLTLGIYSCVDEGPVIDTTKKLASCEGCHSDYAHLQEVHSPDTAAAVGGCGGEAPHSRVL